jgi:hypothetical protein
MWGDPAAVDRPTDLGDGLPGGVRGAGPKPETLNPKP